ncbi:MAG TPA: CoA-transferase [Solirubrobacterales bacterium]|nr:CoA-transferase [Solirubrobacterales bacterium]
MSEAPADIAPDDLIAIAAARTLSDRQVAFVGIGLPSTAAILARRTHAPNLVLVYESGVLETDPPRLPLSVADGALAEHARALVPVPEMFNYWLGGGHVDVGLLGAAQVDRFGNVGSSVVGGTYGRPKVRLPGAGGAPEIGAAARRTTVMIRQNARSFVSSVDFITTVGQGRQAGGRSDLGLPGAGPDRVLTDVGIYEAGPDGGELRLTALQPERSVAEARELTPWDLAVAPDLGELRPPTAEELAVLAELAASEPGAA